MEPRTEYIVAERRSRFSYPSSKFSQSYAQAKNPHPFQHGALVTKDQVRAFHSPASEVRLGLATAMWLQMGLQELPTSHPMHSTLLDRLQQEPPSPSSRSGKSSSFAATQIHTSRLDKLPFEIRLLVYEYSLAESEPICPSLDPLEGQSSPASELVKVGLSVLPQVFPDLANEINAMTRAFCQANTFHFDLREENGIRNLFRWVEKRQDEANAARTISLGHWTWYWRSSDSCWNFVADATVLSLTSTGRIKLTRTAGTLDADSCNCNMNDIVSAQRPDWTMNRTWTLSDFVQALRKDQELLIQALTKFVDLIQHHTESFHAWRNGPKPCTACGKSMIFLRMFDDVEWTSE